MWQKERESAHQLSFVTHNFKQTTNTFREHRQRKKRKTSAILTLSLNDVTLAFMVLWCTIEIKNILGHASQTFQFKSVTRLRKFPPPPFTSQSHIYKYFSFSITKRRWGVKKKKENRFYEWKFRFFRGCFCFCLCESERKMGQGFVGMLQVTICSYQLIEIFCRSSVWIAIVNKAS